MSLSSFSVDSCFNKSTWCLLLVLLLLLLLLLPSCVWEQESDTPETLKLLLVTGQKLEAGGSISQFKLCQRDINTVTCSVHMFLHIVFHVHMFFTCQDRGSLYFAFCVTAQLCLATDDAITYSCWVCVCVCVCVCVSQQTGRVIFRPPSGWLTFHYNCRCDVFI